MNIYDKAAWHIDGGEDATIVVERFRNVFEVLDEKKLLNANGKEVYEFAMDSSISLNSTLLTSEGINFLDTYYDSVLAQDPKDIKKNLLDAYQRFKENSDKGCK